MGFSPDIAVIGAGNIGGQIAREAIERGWSVILYNRAAGPGGARVAEGKALDMAAARPLFGGGRLYSTTDFADIEGARVVICTAGLPRKPGMSRTDLLKANAGIVRAVANAVGQFAPEAFFIVITNPLDAMAYLAWKESGLSRERAVGMGGVLDSNRYRMHLAEALDVSVLSITALVVGAHADTMVPLRSLATCNGIPVTDLLDASTLDRIEARVRNGGKEVVDLLTTGSASFSPARSALEMAEAFLRDEKKVLPVSAILEGEWGASGIAFGVPAVIGKEGIERIFEPKMTEVERQALDKSIEATKELVGDLMNIS